MQAKAGQGTAYHGTTLQSKGGAQARGFVCLLTGSPAGLFNQLGGGPGPCCTGSPVSSHLHASRPSRFATNGWSPSLTRPSLVFAPGSCSLGLLLFILSLRQSLSVFVLHCISSLVPLDLSIDDGCCLWHRPTSRPSFEHHQHHPYPRTAFYPHRRGSRLVSRHSTIPRHHTRLSARLAP